MSVGWSAPMFRLCHSSNVYGSTKNMSCHVLLKNGSFGLPGTGKRKVKKTFCFDFWSSIFGFETRIFSMCLVGRPGAQILLRRNIVFLRENVEKPRK